MGSITIPALKLENPSESIPKLTLRANFGWTIAGNGISAATQWGTVVLLARLGNPAMLGQYALALAICSPAFLLAGLSLRTVQATDVRGEFDFSDYLTLRLLSVAAALVVVGVILATASLREETMLVIL